MTSHHLRLHCYCDGIGNAMLSGMMAAGQAQKCLAAGNFTAGFMKQYDRNVYGALGKELNMHYTVRKMLQSTPFMLDLIFLAGKNKAVKRLIQKAL